MVAKKSLGKHFGLKMIECLGLPKKGVKGFTLRCYVNEIVEIKCEFYPEIDKNEFFEKFKIFELVEKE